MLLGDGGKNRVLIDSGFIVSVQFLERRPVLGETNGRIREIAVWNLDVIRLARRLQEHMGKIGRIVADQVLPCGSARDRAQDAVPVMDVEQPDPVPANKARFGGKKIDKELAWIRWTPEMECALRVGYPGRERRF